MKITELEISGFRSLQHIVWKPGDLNVLIGPNAGGKTNLLRALDLLAHSARGRLAEYVKREGGLFGLSWDGDANNLRIACKSAKLSGVGGPIAYELVAGWMGPGTLFPLEERLTAGKLLFEISSSRSSVFDNHGDEIVSLQPLTGAETQSASFNERFAL